MKKITESLPGYDLAQANRIKHHVRHKGPISAMLSVLHEVRSCQKAITIIGQRLGRINKALSKFEEEYKEQV